VCLQAVKNNLCTFTTTGPEFYTQYWWNCKTCNWGTEAGACLVCRDVCHKGHEMSEHQKVEYVNEETEERCLANYGLFYCDCGSKGTGCKALGY